MGISDIKKGFGEKEEKIEKTSTPPPKEEEKDPSAYGENTSLKRWQVRKWLGEDKVYKIIRQPRKRRIELEKKLFGPESGKYGSLIEKAKKEPERLLREIETGKVKPPTGLTKRQTKSLLKKFLGK